MVLDPPSVTVTLYSAINTVFVTLEMMIQDSDSRDGLVVVATVPLGDIV